MKKDPEESHHTIRMMRLPRIAAEDFFSRHRSCVIFYPYHPQTLRARVLGATLRHETGAHWATANAAAQEIEHLYKKRNKPLETTDGGGPNPVTPHRLLPPSAPPPGAAGVVCGGWAGIIAGGPAAPLLSTER